MFRATLVLLFVVLLSHGSSAQPTPTSSAGGALPTTSTGVLNVSILDRTQYVVGGRSSAFGGLSFWGTAEIVHVLPNSVQVDEVVQTDLTFPTFSKYLGNGYGSNATSFTATFAGPDVALVNSTAGSSTPNGTIWDSEFTNLVEGAEVGSGSARLVPVPYAADELMTSLQAMTLTPPGAVPRLNLSTTYVLVGNATGYGQFTGVSTLAIAPEDGVIDNGTFTWTWRTKEFDGSIATYVATGKPNATDDFSHFTVQFAGAGTGNGSFSVITMTPDGPILQGNFTVDILRLSVPCTMYAFPVKMAVSTLDVPMRKRLVRRILGRGGKFGF